MEKPKVSVIVLNYNGKKYLKGCFESLKKTTYPNFEVVMVDNKSTDNSAEYVKKNFKWIRIIDAGSNMGWAVGNNIGIRNTNGKYVVLLSNDTICTPNWLSEIVNVIESDPQIGVVGSWPVEFVYMKCDLNKFPYKKIQEASTVGGAAMMVRREVFERIGYLEEKYFMYWEDTEFCYRSILAGYKVKLNYDSIVYHLVGGSAKRESAKRWKYEMTKNRLHMHIKLMSSLYLSGFIFFEIGKLFLNLLKLPFCIIANEENFADAVISAWVWNIRNLKNTLHERSTIRNKLGHKYDNRLIYLSLKTSFLGIKYSIIMKLIKKYNDNLL